MDDTKLDELLDRVRRMETRLTKMALNLGVDPFPNSSTLHKRVRIDCGLFTVHLEHPAIGLDDILKSLKERRADYGTYAVYLDSDTFMCYLTYEKEEK